MSITILTLYSAVLALAILHDSKITHHLESII
jgi:hypothetical protein